MKIYVATCDSHIHYLSGFAKLFNRHWGRSYEVIVLGYQAPDFDLPRNFEFVSMGIDPSADFWSVPLKVYLEEHAPDYFILTTEDQFIIRDVPMSLLNWAGHEVRVNQVDKVVLNRDPQRPMSGDYSLHFWLHEQHADYRLTLAASIWKKDYLLRHMTKPHSPWSFEMQTASIDDGATILMPSKEPIYAYYGISRKGKFNDLFWGRVKDSPDRIFAHCDDWQRLTEEDMEVIGAYA